MLMGKCYKLFPETKTQIEAQMTCQENGDVLALPKGHIHSEFLESLISFRNSLANDDDLPVETVWIDIRRGDIDLLPDTYFTDFSAYSNGNLLTESGDCIVISIDSDGKNEGWHRQDCNIESYFICEKSKYSIAGFQSTEAI